MSPDRIDWQELTKACTRPPKNRAAGDVHIVSSTEDLQCGWGGPEHTDTWRNRL